MASKDRVLKVVVLGDSSSAQPAAFGKLDASVDKTERNVGRAQSKLAKFGPAIATGAGLGVAAFIKVGGDAVQAAAEGRKVAAQTEAVIKSTGGVAGITASHLADLSQSLKDHSTYEDEAIQNAGNLLLTFKEIRGQPIFDRATQAVVDMSTLMDGDLKGAAIQVGKALNDPVNGLASLTRIGVSFSPEQKKVIEGLVAIGETGKAQALILDVIEEQFKGQAQAAKDAQTPVVELRRKWEDVQEKMGEIILNQLPAFNAGLKEISTWPGDFQKGLDVLVNWKAPEGSFLDKLAHPGDFLSTKNDPQSAKEKAFVDKMNAEVVARGAKDASRGIPRFAVGGQVAGARDEVPAVLHRGEFVVTKRAVDAVGVPLLDKLNRAPSRRVLNEDEVPYTSPSGAPLKEFRHGRATYSDGSVFTAAGWVPMAKGFRFRSDVQLDGSQVIDRRPQAQRGRAANTIPGFAEGGRVAGARDEVSAIVHRGEFVVRKRAVDAVGVPLLERLNSQGLGNQPLPRGFRFVPDAELDPSQIIDRRGWDVRDRRRGREGQHIRMYSEGGFVDGASSGTVPTSPEVLAGSARVTRDRTTASQPAPSVVNINEGAVQVTFQVNGDPDDMTKWQMQQEVKAMVPWLTSELGRRIASEARAG